MRRQEVSALQGIVRQLCPRCRDGKIFRRSVWLFPATNERCPSCGLKFEREAGYFLGAMYISYALGIATIAAFAMLLWETVHWSIIKCAIGGMILFLPFAPVLTWMARVLWIYLDQGVDPDLS